MLPPVLKHVHEGMAHLARCPQQPCVIAVGPDLSGAPENAVDGLRESDREPLEPTHQTHTAAVGLDDEMNVVGLDGELQNPELRT